MEIRDKCHLCWVKKETLKLLSSYDKVRASNRGLRMGSVSGHWEQREGWASLLDISAPLPT